jgi:hypothetical protein
MAGSLQVPFTMCGERRAQLEGGVASSPRSAQSKAASKPGSGAQLQDVQRVGQVAEAGRLKAAPRRAWTPRR